MYFSSEAGAVERPPNGEKCSAIGVFELAKTTGVYT